MPCLSTLYTGRLDDDDDDDDDDDHDSGWSERALTSIIEPTLKPFKRHLLQL